MELKIYTIDANDHVIARLDADCVDLTAAAEIALRLTVPIGGYVEIWELDKRLKTITPHLA